LKKTNFTRKIGQEHRAELVKLIGKFRYMFSDWQVWDDMTYLCAAAIAQRFQYIQEREDEYLRRINRYPEELRQLFPQMLAEITMAFEQEQFADVLGDLYMEFGLGDHWKGQYFTPYNVCLMMAKMISGNPADKIEKSGFVTVGDTSCGSGAMLIAYAQSFHEQGANYQRDVLFVGQDVDPVVARMAYVQLSLLGCPGYIVIGNTFTQPTIGPPLFPKTDGDIWYTPMFFRDVWHWRKIAALLDMLFY